MHGTIPVTLRWISKCHWHDVLRIEQESFDPPWSEENFLHTLAMRNVIGVAAELAAPFTAGKVVGFMLYELTEGRVDLVKIAVDPPYRRAGIGRQMVARLEAKLSRRRPTIRFDANERDTAA